MTQHRASSETVVVIGAGVAGLAAAAGLLASGRDVIVLEKSRGAGGRVATRDFGGVPFEYGAPSLGDLGDLGVADGESGLRARLAEMFESVLPHVRTRCRAIALRDEGGGLEVRTEDGAVLPCGHVVVALPAPQAFALVESFDGASVLGDIEYAPSVVVALTLRAGTQIAGAFDLAGPSFSRALVSRRGAQLVCHIESTSPTAEHSAASDDELTQGAATALRTRLGLSSFEVDSSFVKRWRYARPLSVLDGACLRLASGRLWVVGDTFGDASRAPLARAFVSGSSIATRMENAT